MYVRARCVLPSLAHEGVEASHDEVSPRRRGFVTAFRRTIVELHDGAAVLWLQLGRLLSPRTSTVSSHLSGPIVACDATRGRRFDGPPQRASVHKSRNASLGVTSEARTRKVPKSASLTVHSRM